MYHKKIKHGSYQKALDNTLLTELIHPIHKSDDPDLSFSLAYAKIAPNKQSKPHQLIRSTEIFIFTKGNGEIIIEEEKEMISSGSIVLVPPKKTQYIINKGPTDLEFYCIVTPPWEKDQDIST